MNSTRLSVVVAATDSFEAASQCAASIVGTEGVEILVVTSAEIPAEQGGSSKVRWIRAESNAGVPSLRWLGFEQAQGVVVAFTEDSCRLDPGWSEAWIRAFDDSAILAASGPVEHEPGGSAIDWAVFFCEYAPFLGPEGGSRAGRLAGNNFAVRRAWLAQVLEDGEEIHESQLASRLLGAGGLIREVERSRAWHVRRFGLREAIRDRLRFGFDFGRLRAAESPQWFRPLAIALGPAILLAQLGRLAWTLARKRRHRERFLTFLPIVAALLLAWSLGEWLGWVIGSGSASRKRVALIESTGGAGSWPRPNAPSKHGSKGEYHHANLHLRR